jgi:predicted dehydrogenase
MKRIAIIGLGKMGLLHASLLNTMTGVKLVAFCEKSGLVRRFSRNIFTGIAIVDGVDKLSEIGLDAAYVTTPPSSHYAVLNTLFAKGICHDVFVEKPLANNLAESKALVSLPANLGISSINMVGYNRRFGVTFKKAKEIISKGALGEPVSFGGHAFSSDFCSVSIRRGSGERGGVIKDLGSHAIDLALWYMGDIGIESIVSSQVLNGVIDAITLRVRTAGGLEGQIRASWIEPEYRIPEIGFTLGGTKGVTLVVNDDKLELRSKNNERRVWYRQDLNDTAGFLLGSTDYLREDETFVNAIIAGRAIEPNFATALRVDEIVQQAEAKVIGQ